MTEASEIKAARQPAKCEMQKLRALLADAGSNVPFYRERFANVDVGVGDAELLRRFSELPIVTKQDMLAVPAEDLVNRRFDPTDLHLESTTGSTGRPFGLQLDKRYMSIRKRRFLRALVSVGYRPWHRLMLLTDRYIRTTRKWPRRFYVPVEQSTSGILRDYQKTKPAVLYGFMTPLRLLAESIVASGHNIHTPDIVVSTAEMLDPHTRRLLEYVFDSPVFDFYGMTEMGLVAWQCPGAHGYRLSSESVLTEFVEDPFCDGRYRMIMTNLDLHATPVLRYDSGDLASIESINGSNNIVAIEGRQIDALCTRNGAAVSPYALTDALRDVTGLHRFRVVQKAVSAISVELEVEPISRNAAERQIAAILEQLLGPGLRLEFTYFDSLIADGQRKFRPVESWVSAS